MMNDENTSSENAAVVGIKRKLEAAPDKDALAPSTKAVKQEDGGRKVAEDAKKLLGVDVEALPKPEDSPETAGMVAVSGPRGKGPMRKPGRRWSAHEDLVLRELVEKNGNRHWKRIAEEFGKRCGSERSDVQCLHRWNKCLKPGLTKGPWSAEEDETIKRMIQENGGASNVRWSVIAKVLNGRLGKQVRERWINHLDPTINKGDWTPDEDENLYQLQKRFGNRWKWIAELMPGRSENGVKNRWHSIKQLLKKQQQEEAAAAGASDGPKEEGPLIPAGKKIKGNAAVTEVTKTVTAAAVAAAVAAAKAAKEAKKELKKKQKAAAHAKKQQKKLMRKSKDSKRVGNLLESLTSPTALLSQQPGLAPVGGVSSLQHLLAIGQNLADSSSKSPQHGLQVSVPALSGSSSMLPQPNAASISPSPIDVAAIAKAAQELLAQSESYQEMARATLNSPASPQLSESIAAEIQAQVAKQLSMQAQVGFGFAPAAPLAGLPIPSPMVSDQLLFNNYFSAFSNTMQARLAFMQQQQQQKEPLNQQATTLGNVSPHQLLAAVAAAQPTEQRK